MSQNRSNVLGEDEQLEVIHDKLKILEHRLFGLGTDVKLVLFIILGVVFVKNGDEFLDYFSPFFTRMIEFFT